MTARRTPDPDAIVAKHWPLNRRSHDHLRTAIATAAELVRYANHITLDNPDTTLEYARELYAVTGAVADLVDRLPQLLRQLSSRANRLAADPTLHSSHGDAAEAMRKAATDLFQATAGVQHSALNVRTARSELTWVSHR